MMGLILQAYETAAQTSGISILDIMPDITTVGGMIQFIIACVVGVLGYVVIKYMPLFKEEPKLRKLVGFAMFFVLFLGTLAAFRTQEFFLSLVYAWPQYFLWLVIGAVIIALTFAMTPVKKPSSAVQLAFMVVAIFLILTFFASVVTGQSIGEVWNSLVGAILGEGTRYGGSILSLIVIGIIFIIIAVAEGGGGKGGGKS